MQPSLRINHSSLPFSSTSEKRITVHDLAVRSAGLSYTPTLCHLVADVVPFGTGHLTGLAADTGSDIDQFGHFFTVVTGARRRRGSWWRIYE